MYDGEQYPDGSDWEILPCTKCVCADGQHSCYPVDCPPVVCAENAVLETVAGTCCPVCHSLNTTCREGSVEYKTGEQWNRDPCTLCVCIGGTVVCTVKECMDLMICSGGEVRVTRPGECCPECVSKSGVCSDVEPVRYSGDIWNTTSCDYCICNDGEVQCYTAVCENIVCFKEEVLVHLPGTCCPQCIIPPSCEFAGQVYPDGERWMADDCSVCICDSGKTRCYTQHCPVCPAATRSIAEPGECCGTCQKVECSPECADCQPSAPDNCTVCTNTKLFVQDGRCLHTCRMGFYPSPSGVCTPCHDTCYTCVGGTQYHCEMCQPGLMWKHGECVTQCGLGYYLQNGRCLECAPSCKSCNGPRSDQCISCTNPAQVVFHGECLDKCPDNFYIRTGKCIACHPTCKTCTPDGSACDSCWQGGYLHLGQCVTRCSVGFYANQDGSCSPCHPACESCSGGYSKNCTSCYPGSRISKKGKCRSLCEKGKYMSVDGTCKDCEVDCSECHEAWNGGTSICSACEERDLLPSGSKCIEKCGPGQFQEFKVCKDCGENCLACTSPTGCTKCGGNMLLYKGLCVEHCAQGQFEDGTSLSCKDCSKDCLRCYSEEDCSVCNSGTFLKNGYCVTECGRGYMPNMETKECQRNTEAPVFKVLNHVQVEDGGITPLHLGLFYISDTDTDLENLYVVMVTSPTNGNLVKVIEGKDVEVTVGVNVSVADLMMGKVRFRHHAGKAFKGKATLQVTDSQLNSHQGYLYFKAILPSAIAIATRSLLIATKAEVTYIQSDVLDLTSLENPESVKLTVLKGPKEGTLYNKNLRIPIRMFTLSDLMSGVIGYKHNPEGMSGQDTVLLQASDGFHLVTFLFYIEVREKENQGPVLMHNRVGHVVLGEKLQISPDLLLAKVMTGHAGSRREEVVYTLVPPLNNPSAGEIMMVVPIPPSGVGHGWEDLGDGNMAARMTRFLQRDIDEGRIWYKNKGTAALTDIIRFEVADMDSAVGTLTDQTFKITVREKKNPGPTTHPTLTNGATLGIRVMEKQLVPITSASLNFVDRDTGPAGILFTITRPLRPQDGMVEHMERPTQALKSFTQDDVNNNRIIYRPPQTELGYREREVFFYFTVSDEEVGVPVQEHKFSIILVPVNDKHPRFMSSTPRLRVSQGGNIPVGPSVVGVTDEDTPKSDLTVTLTRAPHNGKLEKVEKGLKATVRQGDTFTYSEIELNVFQYQHDGSAGLYDTMQLSVSDGEHSTSTSIDITVMRVDQSAPYMLPSATCRLVVREGTSEVVTRQILAFTDSDDEDFSLNIMLTIETTHGKLLLSNQQVLIRDVFTQTDINNKQLSFLADSEIGDKAVSEVLTFNVTDTSGNVLPSQTLTVLIEPDNNLPPRVKVISGVKVQEGGQVTLTSDNLEVTDPDTILDDLIIVIETQPGFGVIKDIAPVEGSELLEDRLVSSFPVSDLLNNYIIYVQSDNLNKEPIRDSFLFHIEDGKNRSPSQRFNITIKLVNDEAPKVVTEQVFVQEGQQILVTNASVYITDLDTPNDQILISLQMPPEHGTLKRKSSRSQSVMSAVVLKKDSEFTYKGILEELILYVHDGGEVTVDSFSLAVTDGNFTDTHRVPVIIGLINDETPRVTVNRGLRVHAGTTTTIRPADLRSTDVDSDDSYLIYTVTRDPRIGAIYLTAKGRQLPVTSRGPVKTFTQADIDNGNVEYRHVRGETTGNIVFKFTVSDLEGNDLIDQDFYITILDDRSPPRELANKELVVKEGGKMTVTTEYLSFTDDDSEPATLLYILIEKPDLGHFELTRNPGKAVSEFTQSDIAGSQVQYVHTSESEEHLDSCMFSISDGTNEVIRKFTIQISPVDDSIPVVTKGILRVQEGLRKLITEFDLKASDEDTKEDSLVFTITRPPRHGSIQHLTDSDWKTTTVFSMTEIYESHVCYLHNGRETTKDSFKFTLSDGSNDRFSMIPGDGRGQYTVSQSQPQVFSIEIIPMDDDSPVIEVNKGLQFLEVLGSSSGNIITANELKVTDLDTPPDKLKFVVRSVPQFGRLEKTTNPGVDVLTFTQEDIDNSVIRYILTAQGAFFEDSFMFDIYDSRPNRIPGNTFHLTWSTVEFEQALVNVTETAGIVHIPVKRRGSLKHYSIVTCRSISGTATTRQQGTRPGQQDFVPHLGQVQFDEWQDTKMCTIIINDDSIFEGRETFYVELIQPTFTLLGTRQKTTVTIVDMEDEPVLQFQYPEYHVNESESYLSAAIIRTGDISSTVSTICYTSSLTARGSPLDRLDSGSDYISRGNSNSYRVIFPSGITKATCDVKMIDDSINEASEQFGLELALPSYGAKLGPVSQATVIIDGPNDESVIHFSQTSYKFDENSGTVEVEIIREGSDLSHTSTVWCATRLTNPPSAVSGQDYVPSSSQITFGPGQKSQKCHLTLLDDDLDPKVEGDETFSVFLSSAVSSSLVQPFTAIIHILDTQLDVPTMSFQEESYKVDESKHIYDVPIYRSGDTSFESSVICYTRQKTAAVMVDYIERTLSEESRIVFKAGEKIKNCTVGIVDDDMFEDDEILHLKLTRPLGTEIVGAKIGDINSTEITITNLDDVPRIQFEKSAYSIPEPSAKDQIAMVTVKVIRLGDASKVANVRCSTRDGSAFSGTDYNPKSQILQFAEGVRSLDFTIDILYNSDIEWHETFSIVLGPGDPVGAELGSVSMATITILDNDVSGSLVLPAPPVVVSLLKYDDVEAGMKIDPTPGYPLVCITPCSVHHPTYKMTHSLCEEAKINQSAMFYRWEVAIPDMTGTRPPFIEVSYNTLFTSVNHMVLDTIYFRPSFRVRCIAQPLDGRGNPGIPLKSNPVMIGRDNGICKAPVFSGLPYSYQAQSFHAKLDYVGTEDKMHPNTVHITIKVPHQDGMLPLISTSPISNLKYVLSEPVYRQQHICSNLITPKERAPLLKAGFLNGQENLPKYLSAGFDYPYQFDDNLRENKTLMLYKYLDLKKCLWTFEAWYHMTDLVDLCGGRAVSDFQVKDIGQTYLTVRVPLYVSYLYAVAPIGWGSLEHRTELEFSFYYDTVLWRSGLETEGDLGGRLQVMRILIDDNGRLVVDFKTQAKFRGMYVLDHHTLPGYTSRFVSVDKDISFDLDLLWGQNTFDGPHQLWRATSDYSLKDYTGEYIVELIPCTVQSTQGYTIHTPPPCTAHQPLRFDVPIAFQQTNRPVPLEYTLNTHFQITNNEQMFVMNPFTDSFDMEDMDSDTHIAFSKGDKIYGRVLWSPEQNLKDAYTLLLEKVFICAGRDGHVPTYDPTGTVYNNGPQFGCIQPVPDLKYRFLILDRGAPDITSKAFQGVPFDAQFVSENPMFSSLLSIHGVDGFIISVDPLYKVTSGFQWYLQVIYSIGPTDFRLFRRKRSALLSLDRNKRSVAENTQMKYDWLENNKSKNGTNIKVLHLNNTQVLQSTDTDHRENLTPVLLPVIIAVIIIVAVILFFLVRHKRKRKRHKPQPPKKRNNLELAQQNSVIFKGNQNFSVRAGSSLELKESVIYKGDHGKTAVRVKDTNIQKNKNISKGNGTEV
ncbi:extracellular matrix organizing protein FRAS1-like isoform X2 [Mercenaria mercenaria]|nr:extracellular matrix organizing protein FRAS1-like isoform X2 [Mercenaria mercenaria]